MISTHYYHLILCIDSHTRYAVLVASLWLVAWFVINIELMLVKKAITEVYTDHIDWPIDRLHH